MRFRTIVLFTILATFTATLVAQENQWKPAEESITRTIGRPKASIRPYLAKLVQTARLLEATAHNQKVVKLLQGAVLYEAARFYSRRATSSNPVPAQNRQSFTTSSPKPSAQGGMERWRPLIARHSWNVDFAMRVAWCESRGDPNADNPTSTANGLFQILGGPFDPSANVALAFSMYQNRGWQPWYSSRSCWG